MRCIDVEGDIRQASLLDAQPNSPAMLTKLSVYAQGDAKPIEYSWSVTRGDKCKFYFRFREEGVNSN
jgi:DNA-binding GntR family transcriptional regulator